MPDTLDWKPVETPPADLQWEPAAPAAPAAPSRLRRFIADPAISAVKGAIGVPEAAVGLADIVTGGRAGKAAEAVGFRPKEAKAILDTLYSPEQQAANQTVADAEGFLPTAGAMLRNPSTIAHAVIESAPSVLGGAGVARGLVKAGVPIAAAAGLGEGAVSAGSTAEQIRQESETGLLTGKQAGIAGVSGLATAGLGAAGNRLAKRFKVPDVDALLTSADDAVTMHPAKALAAGAVTEGVFEELPQSAQEQAAQNYATGKPVGEGVAKAAASGALAGGVMGGGVASVKSLLAKHIGTSRVNEHIQSIPDMPVEEQRPAVAELAAAVHPENPVAAVEFQAEVLDRLDAGEPVVDTTPEPAPPTKETLVEALQEAVASGGEINPVEVLQGKEETQVLEALRKERPLPTEPVADVPPTAQVRAERWLKEGRTLTREGMTPDPEVAALLDDMGYTLTQGERADRTKGGSIARREWLVEKVEPVVEAPPVQEDDGTVAHLASAADRALDKAYGYGLSASGSFGGEANRSSAKAALSLIRGGETDIEALASAIHEGWSETARDYPDQPAEKKAKRVKLAETPYSELPDDEKEKDRVAARAILQAFQKTASPAPIQHKEQRQAYPDNPNLKVARENDAILIYDDAAFTRAKDLKDTLGMKASILGMAKIKDGKFNDWVEGREPGTLEERVQLERVLRGHLGEVRFSRARTKDVKLYRGVDNVDFPAQAGVTSKGVESGSFWTTRKATAKNFSRGPKSAILEKILPASAKVLDLNTKAGQKVYEKLTEQKFNAFRIEQEGIDTTQISTGRRLADLLKEEGYVAVHSFDIDGPETLVLDPSALKDAPATSGKDVAKTPHFKKWFGDSKVVDEKGEPLVVYHGTMKDFDVFDMGDEGGAFFTTNPANASEYAGSWGELQGDNGRIMPVYLSIQNPYTVTSKQWLEGEGLDPEDAKTAGYDGYKIEGQDGGTTYIAFSPTQIKSATGNNGEFDPENPDIRYAAGAGQGLPAAEISQHLAPVLEKLKVPVQVVATAEEIPGLDTDVKFTGVFLNGKIYLNAANLTSKEEAESVLLQHEIRHAGLRSIFDRKGLDALLAKTWGDLNSGVSAFAKDRGIDTRSREGKLEAAEEYIVELAKTEDQSPVWDRFVALFKALLRRVGFNLKLSDTELRWLVARSGEVIVEGALPGETGSRFAAAWHGTPHKFDKFSLSKIGTGEGAQAYGYGLYFAGSKAVAEYYREALRPNTPRSWRTTIAGVNIRDYPGAPGGLPMAKIGTALEAAGTVQGAIAEIENAAWATGEGGLKVQAKALEFLRTLPPDGEVVIEPVPDGHLYQVELAPEEDEYLLWDKPLSEQSEKVKAAVEKVLAEIPEDAREEYEYRMNASLDEITGGEFYKKLLRRMANDDLFPYGGSWDAALEGGNTDPASSEYLHSLGIRGIKYLDGTSRGAGEGNYNYVIFSDEDVEIKARFARLSPKEAINEVASRTELTIAKRVLSDVSGNVWRSVMPVDRTIKLAQSIPLYAPIKNLLGDYLIHKRAKAAATDAHATRAQKNREAHEEVFTSDADTKAFNTLTAKATLYELHADGRNAGWTDASWEKAGKLKQTGKTLGAARSEVAELWVKLTPEQQKVQQKIIDHMRVIADEHREALLEPLRLSFGEEMFDQADAVASQILTLDDKGRAALQTSTPPNVHSLALQIAQIKAERTLKGDYAPLTRFGDHIVRTFRDGKRIKTQIFESKKAADDAIAAIKATPGVYPEYELKPEGERATTNIPLAFLEQLKMAAEARGITGESLDALMDDFMAARLQTMPRATIAGNSLHREGIEGYSEDMLRSYAAYASRSGRAIANLKYGTLIEQTFRDMGNAIHAYQDPEGEWDPHAVERMSTLKENLYRLERQANIEKINELTKLLGKATFLWYLSSPSVWAVQWSQPFMTTIPKMAARYGFTKAFGAYTSEVKQYLSGAFSDEKIDAFNTLHENAGERLFALIQEERRALPHEKKGIRSAMQALYNGFDEKGKKLLILKVLGLQGMLDLSSSHALQDLIAGASAGDKLMDKVVSKGAFFMQKSETGSRRAAAVSAFQLALDNGRDIMEANDYAANIIDDTLADFSSQNRPGLMRGNVGRIIGQFQFFRLHMLGKVVQLFKDAYGEEGWGENRKELSYMVGMSMALAGAGGTPIALAFSNSATSLIFSALAMAFGDPDDPWEPEQEFYAAVREAMGDTAGNAFLMGLPTLFGMDVSKRIGMGGFADVLSGEPPPGLSGTQKAQWYASRMLGPSFGLFSDSMRAFDALADGDIGEAMAVSSPKVVKDFIKTTQLSEKGITGIGGKTVTQPDEVSPVSLALQLVGINPAEVALAQQERREVAALSTSLRERRSLLTKRVTEATLDGDFDAREEALGAINEWGAKQPALMITQKELLAAVKKGMRMRAGVLSEKEMMLQEKVRGL